MFAAALPPVYTVETKPSKFYLNAIQDNSWRLDRSQWIVHLALTLAAGETKAWVPEDEWAEAREILRKAEIAIPGKPEPITTPTE